MRKAPIFSVHARKTCCTTNFFGSRVAVCRNGRRPPLVVSNRPLIDTLDFVAGIGSWGPFLSVVVATVLGMSSAVETPAAAGQWWRVDDTELRTALTDMQIMMRRNYHAMLEMVREADSRGLAGSSGYPNLPALLADMLRIPRAQAAQCVEQARLVIPAAWEVAIVNGRPEFYPPPFLDPQRNPLINHLHHHMQQ